jgi:hypothetical protein
VKFNFRFGRRFGDDKLSPEQKAVVERLERGEISEEEAEKLLGGDVRILELRIGGGTDAPAEAKESSEDAKAREMIEKIAQQVDAEGRG